MENEPDVIRQQMSDTRTSLTEKLETLETQVTQTVQGAASAVTETVEGVREAVMSSVASVQGTVRDTVETVKDTFDINQWVQRYPWAALGVSAAAGLAVGSLLAPKRRSGSDSDTRLSRYGDRPNGFVEPQRRQPERGLSDEPSRPSWLSELGQTFESETRQLKGLALAAVLGAVRDYLRKQVPGSVAPQLAEIMDNMTQKLGGQPIRGPVFQPETPSESSLRTY